MPSHAPAQPSYKVGTVLRKKFGKVFFLGRIESYKPLTKYYHVAYEDSDREDLTAEEIRPLALVGGAAENFLFDRATEQSKRVGARLNWIQLLLLETLRKIRRSGDPYDLFCDPVDPVRHDCADYFDVVPREEAMDLGTIIKRIDAGTLTRVGEFERLVEQVVSNAIRYNSAEDHVVHVQAITLRRAASPLIKYVRKRVDTKLKDIIDSTFKGELVYYGGEGDDDGGKHGGAENCEDDGSENAGDSDSDSDSGRSDAEKKYERKNLASNKKKTPAKKTRAKKEAPKKNIGVSSARKQKQSIPLVCHGLASTFSNGSKVRKLFDGKYYGGKITDFKPSNGFYTVAYSDGDMEEMTEEEIEKILLPPSPREGEENEEGEDDEASYSDDDEAVVLSDSSDDDGLINSNISAQPKKNLKNKSFQEKCPPKISKKLKEQKITLKEENNPKIKKSKLSPKEAKKKNVEVVELLDSTDDDEIAEANKMVQPLKRSGKKSVKEKNPQKVAEKVKERKKALKKEKKPRQVPKERKKPQEVPKEGKKEESKVVKSLKYPVGTTVQKEFDGTFYGGTVVSYSTTTCWYRVQYEDEDREDLTESEMAEIVHTVPKVSSDEDGNDEKEERKEQNEREKKEVKTAAEEENRKKEAKARRRNLEELTSEEELSDVKEEELFDSEKESEEESEEEEFSDNEEEVGNGEDEDDEAAIAVDSSDDEEDRKKQNKKRNARKRKPKPPKYDIGQRVCKTEANLDFFGHISDFTPDGRYYTITYEDDDVEDVGERDVASLLVRDAPAKSRKRRRRALSEDRAPYISSGSPRIVPYLPRAGQDWLVRKRRLDEMAAEKKAKLAEAMEAKRAKKREAPKAPADVQRRPPPPKKSTSLLPDWQVRKLKLAKQRDAITIQVNAELEEKMKDVMAEAGGETAEAEVKGGSAGSSSTSPFQRGRTSTSDHTAADIPTLSRTESYVD
eukprot:CAMPEP_0194305434 /NCGR_PEP_ID=MMETSP0171-20130528/2873_1 /TAXON_ID=218684 /ORGANISM="Corethron pennatum, Strain L29A3" /LENGTH=958 /DNA_ID=CAMNT_0039056963 /DNA_START=310 /DNA_END=3183 /DNA_ORIENTATION=-